MAHIWAASHLGVLPSGISSSILHKHPLLWSPCLFLEQPSTIASVSFSSAFFPFLSFSHCSLYTCACIFIEVWYFKVANWQHSRTLAWFAIPVWIVVFLFTVSPHSFVFLWFSMVWSSEVPLITSSCSASSECTENKWGKMRGDKNEGSRMGARGRCLMSHRPTKPSSILIAAQSELIISSALHSPCCEWAVQPPSDHNPEPRSCDDAFSLGAPSSYLHCHQKMPQKVFRSTKLHIPARFKERKKERFLRFGRIRLEEGFRSVVRWTLSPPTGLACSRFTKVEM